MKIYALRHNGRVAQYESRSWVAMTRWDQIVVCTGINGEGKIRSSLRREARRRHGAYYIMSGAVGARRRGDARPRWQAISSWRGEVRVMFAYGWRERKYHWRRIDL